ncbi:MAG: hypothetical protein Q7S82_00760 [bacterium]|nr:hypothetical protein [bacterium]
MFNKLNLSIVILALATGILGFYYYQKNIYSKETLKLEILSQDSVDLLEEVEYIVKYKNNGNARLEEPELTFEFPEYSIPAGENSLRVVKKTEDLGGPIYPGQEKIFRFKARLLGKENEAKIAKATLSYQPKNLKARYESATSFITVIKKVPLTFEFDLPSQSESGKDIRFKLNYFSNTDYPIQNLRITVEYPSDFEFIESTPKSLEKIEWDLGSLNKAEGGRIEIAGKLRGNINDEKIFQAKIGIWQGGEFILLKTAQKGVEIAKPDINITQQINGSPDYTASPGDLLHYEISFKNFGEVPLTNLFLINRLDGAAFDFQTLKSNSGDFEPGDNSVVFDWKRVQELQFLNVGGEGKVEFWIKLKEDFGVLNNTAIQNKVYLSQAKEEFINKVNTKLVIDQKGYFQDEIFGNSGPIPPKVGESTTYTITWQAKNYYNNTKNIKVKAVLPREVKLTGKIFPEGEAGKFAFDSLSRELVWEVGEMSAGQGVQNSPLNISFQVVFIPTASQIGMTAELIGQASITGEDQWTKDSILALDSAITTDLPDDDTVSEQQGIVQ